MLDHNPHVFCHARNDQLGLTVPYVYSDDDHSYEPDFLVRLKDEWESVLVLEVKGREYPETPVKHEAARRWRDAVNNLHGWNGRLPEHWRFWVTRDAQHVAAELAQIVQVPPGHEDDFARPLDQSVLPGTN